MLANLSEKTEKKNLGKHQIQRHNSAILKSNVSTTRFGILFNVFCFDLFQGFFGKNVV